MITEPRVLILEDMATDAELTERELRKAGLAFTVKHVETKDAFLKALTEFAPDVILSDYGLPQFSGLEALRLLRERNYDIPFILVTGSLTEEVAVECMKEGASDYVLKMSLKRLPSAVLNVLEKSEAKHAREEAIAELRRSEERYRNVIENVKEVIFQTDGAGRWIFLNPAWTEITGFTIEESLGQSYLNFVYPEDRQINLKEQYALNKEGEQDCCYELRYLQKDGGFCWMDVHARLTLNGQGEVIGTYGSLRDITKRKRAEDALRESEAKLRLSQRLEAVGQLAGGIAHDFNNLLTVINGYSDMTLRRVGEGDPVRHYLEEIKKAGGRAAALTHQLLAFSRKQVLQPKVLNLNAIVTDMDKMFRRLIGEDIDILTAPAPDLGHVKADAGQIEQVLLNLVVNARDAMPAGGKLTIETANVELSGAYAREHISVQPGHYVVLAVSDNGCGMDAETKSRIFEPFYTTKQQGKGTGLGLSTVYGIIKQSGGNIWVYSEVGRGTTFKIYLPRVDEAVELPEATKLRSEIRQACETILLVEDEDGVRELLREVLAAEGYTVLETASGSGALDYCQSYGGDIDLMLTDVVMPKLSGKELAEYATGFRPRMKVIFMSGYTDDAIIHHGVLDPGVEFVEKPFTPEAVIRKVRDVLDASLQRTSKGAERINTVNEKDHQPDTMAK